MSKGLAQLQAMISRDSQLTNGATPGASGSHTCHDASRSNDPPVALAQTTTAAKWLNQQGKATGRTLRGRDQRYKSESPLRPLDESDDGGRFTDEEDA
ncbi:hypothetical protein FRC11_005167 [Ceratobasidium sp. 423]|nr:hypothetical protein FRC11_005167 [Ceratobasidium sp. 423]